MQVEENKHILLIDKASNWLQIWSAASSLDVKGNKAIKNKLVFLANQLVFPNTVTYNNGDTSSDHYILLLEAKVCG